MSTNKFATDRLEAARDCLLAASELNDTASDVAERFNHRAYQLVTAALFSLLRSLTNSGHSLIPSISFHRKEMPMRSVAERRLPTILIILLALAGVAVSVAIGRVIAPGVGEEESTGQYIDDSVIATKVNIAILGEPA